jgi:hypothetical protein
MRSKTQTISRLDYCRYLLNYTLTNYADLCQRGVTIAINRYLAREKVTPHQVWENARVQIVTNSKDYVVFDAQNVTSDNQLWLGADNI